jgi:F-type H+-transporting ATPase subunit a
VPKVLYILLTPLEFFSTFILRPITLTLRLTMNMIAGHFLLVLCFAATQFFFFTLLADGNLLGPNLQTGEPVCQRYTARL